MNPSLLSEKYILRIEKRSIKNAKKQNQCVLMSLKQTFQRKFSGLMSL